LFSRYLTGPKLSVSKFKNVYTILAISVFFLCCVTSVPSPADAKVTSLYQSVDQALKYSPQLQALNHNHEAIVHELKQSRARYFPSIDLELGYGIEQYSDSTTRDRGADPSNTDWDSRQDAALKLTQPLYDGGEINKQISIQKALLDAATFSVQEATQAIILDTIRAHLGVYMQQKLVALAEKDLHLHQDILQALSEKEQAGAGNIADVYQTQARLAKAQSSLLINKGDLSRAISNYERVVGSKPGELSFAGVPGRMPNSLEEAWKRSEQKNSGLFAMKAKLIEAEARADLARTNYKPKINLELSSTYHDQLEGDSSWQNTNDAMLVFRWNLFKGGQDKEAAKAALSREYESRSNLTYKRIELREATSDAWTTYLSLQGQRKAYLDAVAFSKNTFGAYLKQFNVSRRSLIDVLNAEKEYFQSARQLVSVSVNEIIVAHRILMLGGELQISNVSNIQKDILDVNELARTIIFPAAAQSISPEVYSSSTSMRDPNSVPMVTKDHLALSTASETISSAHLDRLYSIEVGPFINDRELTQANSILHSSGNEVRQTPGAGTVRFSRVFEGVYPADEVSRRLEELGKMIESAFVLPKGDQFELYLGSFHDPDRATRFAELLGKKGINVTVVAAEKKMQGTILVVQQVDLRTAESITEQMERIGFTVKLIELGSRYDK